MGSARYETIASFLLYPRVFSIFGYSDIDMIAARKNAKAIRKRREITYEFMPANPTRIHLK